MPNKISTSVSNWAHLLFRTKKKLKITTSNIAIAPIDFIGRIFGAQSIGVTSSFKRIGTDLISDPEQSNFL